MIGTTRIESKVQLSKTDDEQEDRNFREDNQSRVS